MADADAAAPELEGASEALRGTGDDGIGEPRPSVRKKTKRVRPREPGEAPLTSPPKGSAASMLDRTSLGRRGTSQVPWETSEVPCLDLERPWFQ